MTRAAVVGMGSWGTAFGAIMADAGCQVRLLGRNDEVVQQVSQRHRNEAYLPGIDLPPGLRAGTDPAWALEGADILAIAVPAQQAGGITRPLRDLVGPRSVIVSLMKGIELGTDRRMSHVLADTLAVPLDRVAVVSGPNLAHEIARHEPAATVVASCDESVAKSVAKACAAAYFRPYTNTDVIGVELCGAVKNVIALAVGMAQGRGFGFNTMATLLVRGLAEMTRLGLAIGARPETFAGLAGAGDLAATCASPDSRNHSLGVRLGRGLSLEKALEKTPGVAESVKTCQSVFALARGLDVDMPITEAVVDVLYGDLKIVEIAERLLSRPHKAEGIVPAESSSQLGT